MASTFRKLVVTKLSTNFKEAVKIVTETLRPPNDDEVLLKNLYVGVNATDLNIIAGRYFKHGPIPYEFGIEALSRVEKVGVNLAKLYSPGQFVVIKTAKLRAYAEYIYGTTSDSCTVVPSDNPDYLALIGTSGLTAAVGLNEGGKLSKGETVLVTAAAGGLGQLAVQWAKIQGCHVIATCSSDKKVEFLKSLNCDRIINYKKENLDQVLKQEYPNGIDVIWETIGSPLFEMLFEHIARKGRLVNVGATSGYRTVGYAPINIPDFIVKLHYGAKTLVGFLVMDYKDQYKKYSDQLIDLYNQNKFKVHCDLGSEQGNFSGLEGVYDAIEYLHNGLNLGKVIVKVE